MRISIEVYFILILLVIPSFFFWRWILKKIIKKDKIRKIATWGVSIFTAPIIYVGFFSLWFLIISYYPNHSFDREQWFLNKEKRYEMSKDIIKSEMLIGITKEEVITILGQEAINYENDCWSYYLGVRPGFVNIDPDVLDVEFKDGKVIKVGQHET